MIIQIRISLIHLLFFSLCTKLVFAKTKCIKEEREALLNFKHGVVDNFGLLSSWNDEEEEDCCKWIGVRCSNMTGHVVMLAPPAWTPGNNRLRQLGGNISSSLLELQELNYLDLSYNNFSTIPKFIGSLTNLQHLDLYHSFPNTVGVVPYEIGNLTKLQYLNLGGNHYIKIEKIEWLSNLRFLKYLDLSYMNLSGLTNWEDGIDMLPSLVELYIGSSSLPNVTTITSNRSINSSKSLAVVHLSGNDLSCSMCPWLLKFKSLRTLDLSFNYLDQELDIFFNELSAESLQILYLKRNRFNGSLPDFTKKFISLSELSLSYNKLSGTFPESFGQISPLTYLDVSSNQIGGQLPDLAVFPSLRRFRLEGNLINGILTESIGQLLELEMLDVSSNFLEGKISEVHFSNLSKLQQLDLSYNSLSLEMSADWVPTFQLNTLQLASCNVGTRFPNWLYNQNKLSLLDISYTGIFDTVPNWFWDSSSKLSDLNLSHNQIHGTIPDLSSKLGYSPRVDLSSNYFSGTIPLFPSNVSLLDLSKNMFSGPINTFLCGINNLELFMLDLSDNLLSQELPNCWQNLGTLEYLNLANNRFIGKLPHSIGFLDSLEMLNIRNNSISGELPLSLKYCIRLRLLDLGDNKLSGEIPHWLGESLPDLVVISFRSNKFSGTLPSTLCDLANIQVLDLSTNNISGTIPNCINNFTAMVHREGRGARILFLYSAYYFYSNYFVRAVIFNTMLEWKGRQTEYENTLGLVKIIDLSNNKLTGEIPDAITNLAGLVALNLSRNNLTGTISSNIGQLRWLDFLDLSNNDLSGEIPAGLTHVSNLAVLDLSNNNLFGKIPTSTQLQSFSASTYMGNLGLCGPPLTSSCNDEEEPPGPTSDENEDGGLEDKFINLGFYVSVVLGFAFGFWGFVGTLILMDKWRYAYFQRLNTVVNRGYVTMTLKMARLQRRI